MFAVQTLCSIPQIKSVFINGMGRGMYTMYIEFDCTMIVIETWNIGIVEFCHKVKSILF